MKLIPHLIVSLLVCTGFTAPGHAADAPAAGSAKELAATLSALQQDGTSYARLKMDLVRQPGAPKVTIQLQIKQRRTPTVTEVVYQVLWPKEQAGEAVLLRRTGSQAVVGSLFTPPGPCAHSARHN